MYTAQPSAIPANIPLGFANILPPFGLDLPELYFFIVLKYII